LDRVIVAFDTENNRMRVKDMLEREGIHPASCQWSGAAALRALVRMGGGVLVCGFKLSDMSAAELSGLIPDLSVMLVVAPASQLHLFNGDNVFKLPAPVSRSDLAASVRMLMQMEHQMVKRSLPQRSHDDKALIASAKMLLIERNSMSEDQAYRFLQKKSMDSGLRMIDVAREILEDGRLFDKPLRTTY